MRRWKSTFQRRWLMLSLVFSIRNDVYSKMEKMQHLRRVVWLSVVILIFNVWKKILRVYRVALLVRLLLRISDFQYHNFLFEYTQMLKCCSIFILIEPVFYSSSYNLKLFPFWIVSILNSVFFTLLKWCNNLVVLLRSI